MTRRRAVAQGVVVPPGRAAPLFARLRRFAVCSATFASSSQNVPLSVPTMAPNSTSESKYRSSSRRSGWATERSSPVSPTSPKQATGPGGCASPAAA